MRKPTKAVVSKVGYNIKKIVTFKWDIIFHHVHHYHDDILVVIVVNNS
jgi:hypothetical protein